MYLMPLILQKSAVEFNIEYVNHYNLAAFTPEVGTALRLFPGQNAINIMKL